MLSPNTSLNRGRYLIRRNLWSDDSCSIYDARDADRETDVAICESASTDMSPLELAVGHPAVVGIQDRFTEFDMSYRVSRPVAGECILPPLSSVYDLDAAAAETGLGRLISAFSAIESAGVTGSIGLTPAHIRMTSEHDFRLIYFGSELVTSHSPSQTGRSRPDLAFLPLERFWDGLDHASQTTIAHSYDDGSLDVLVSPPDLRSDMFTLGAFFYWIFTCKLPFDALERSIEILDGKPDPLVPPHLVSDAVPTELSEFIMKLMRLRREDRYQSFAQAVVQYDVMGLGRHGNFPIVRARDDDTDLLEIPGFAHSPKAIVASPFVSRAENDAYAVRAPSPVKEFVPTIPHDSGSGGEPFGSSPADRFLADRVFATEVLSPISTSPINEEDPFAAKPKRHWSLSPASVAALALVLGLLVISGGVLYMTNASTEEPPSARPVAVTGLEVDRHRSEVPETSPALQPPAEPSVPAATAPGLEPPDPKPAVNLPVTAPGKTRPQVADVRLPKHTEPVQTDGTKAKKKVTVDDLINDN